jgi:hypothetical protein
MTSTMPRRQAFPTRPGQPLYLPRSLTDLVVNQSLWLQTTGLTMDEHVASTLLTVPVPLYLAFDEPDPAPGQPDRRRTFPTVAPEVLWHPLFWLPPRLASRYRYVVDGRTLMENDEEWALRVVLELSNAGVYDQVSGTWLDVLSTVGLDANDPVDRARVVAWQRGASDPALDGIDLSGLVDVADESRRHWAFEVAATLVEPLREAAWACQADDLVAMAADVSDPTNPAADEPGAIHVAAGIVLDLARVALSDVPVDDAGTTLESQWTAMRAQLDGIEPFDVAAVLDGPVAVAANLLYDVRETYWPVVEEISAPGRLPTQPTA